MTAADLYCATHAISAPRRIRRRRLSWFAILDLVMTALGVTIAGAVIGIGLAL